MPDISSAGATQKPTPEIPTRVYARRSTATIREFERTTESVPTEYRAYNIEAGVKFPSLASERSLSVTRGALLT